jgi:hypothetical protein
VRPALQQLANPVAVALDIGLPKGDTAHHRGRDLDNYLFPHRCCLGPARLASTFAREHHGRFTSTIGPPHLDADVDLAAWSRTPPNPA